jgi:hypothetical protein
MAGRGEGFLTTEDMNAPEFRVRNEHRKFRSQGTI